MAEAQRDRFQAGAQDGDGRGAEPHADDRAAGVVGPTRIAFASPERQHGQPMAVGFDRGDLGLDLVELRELERAAQPVEQAAAVVERAAQARRLRRRDSTTVPRGSKDRPVTTKPRVRHLRYRPSVRSVWDWRTPHRRCCRPRRRRPAAMIRAFNAGQRVLVEAPSSERGERAQAGLARAEQLEQRGVPLARCASRATPCRRPSTRLTVVAPVRRC